VPGWLRPATGGLVTGLLAAAGFAFLGVGGITGGGYSTLDLALWGHLPVKALIPLCAMKLVATVMSYSSGGAGGIFAPSLFVGGMAGGAIGALDMHLFHHGAESMGAFALVGMGAVFAGVVRAPITSVLIIIEMTDGYSLIVPLMIANMTAYMLARYLRPTPIYEALLQQDGIDLSPPRAAESDRGLSVEQVQREDRPFSTLSPGQAASEMLEGLDRRQEVFPVVDGGRLVGIVTLDDLTVLASEPQMFDGLIKAADLMRAPVSLRPGDELHQALETMQAAGLRELPLVGDDGRLLGLLDELSIAHAYVQHRQAGRGSQ
jgi:CIC family chloride channel protein